MVDYLKHVQIDTAQEDPQPHHHTISRIQLSHVAETRVLFTRSTNVKGMLKKCYGNVKGMLREC